MCPSKDKTYDTSFLTAYTNVRTYLTDPNQLDIIYIDSKEKESALRLLLQNKNLAETNQFLARNQINYIVCGQRDEFKFIKSLNDNEVLENQDVLIKRIN